MKTLKIFQLISICLIGITTANAQRLITVQNNSKVEHYTGLEAAITASAAGDTIYLPGGLIEVENDLVIDKKLAIIGAGWDADSIGGNTVTSIKKGSNVASINLKNGSSGSLLTGCTFYEIKIGDEGVSVQDIVIQRNTFVKLQCTNNLVRRILVQENFVSGSSLVVAGMYSQEFLIQNNIFTASGDGLGEFKNSTIKNNIIHRI